ncbi:MAG: hypothetical protein QNJ91_14915 [Gammaproteobacteria bacterium]|nr:hypothetical protein [Gammaproteobacteria bacterium]
MPGAVVCAGHGAAQSIQPTAWTERLDALVPVIAVGAVEASAASGVVSGGI